MPKNKYLVDCEKAQITAYKKCGLSNREIGRKIGRSEKVVRNFLKLGAKYGIKPKTKGRQKITPLQRGRIRVEATKNHLCSSQIVNKLLLPIGSRQVQRILSTTSNVKWKKPCCKPLLKATHRLARFEFARKHMAMDKNREQVIFSDEKKFNLDGLDGLSHYWHDLRHNSPPKLSRNFGGGSLMVWAAFSYNGRTPICFVSTKMNSEMYTDLLDDVLVTFMEDVMDEKSIFQQDNARIHVSRYSKAWFQERNIPLLDWPACSPDLNPIENLWGLLARAVYRNGRQFNTVVELKIAIQNSWREIRLITLKKLIDSMPSRICDVIRKGGGSTKY